MRRFLSRPRRERGAVAIIVAALAIVLFGVAALGVDIASQVNRKHLLKNQLDAAATAAAYYLDTESTGIRDAATNAITYFEKNGKGTLDPAKIDFWCVVARKQNADGTPATPAQVANYQIPSSTQPAGVCNPDAASTNTTWLKSDYQNRVRYDGRVFQMSCSNALCAVPCALQAKPANNWSPGLSIANNLPITCNTIRVGADQDVPFTFAPVLGVDKGSTGSQIAVACKGTCGSIAPNPMNVVVVTDRTGSMSDTNLHSLIAGVQKMLGVMNPSVQYVALGTIGRSKATSRTGSFSCSANMTGLNLASNVTTPSALWVPLRFYNDFQNSNGSLNGNSILTKALKCIDPNESGSVAQSNGTYLAAPFKAAARFTLNSDSSVDTAGWNANSLGTRSGAIRNVVIFETDGQPYEETSSASGSCGVATVTGRQTGCGNSYDVFSDFRTSTSSSHTSSTETSATSASGCPSGTSFTPYNGANACATTYGGTCSTGTLGTTGTWAGFCWSTVNVSGSNDSQKKNNCQNGGNTWGVLNNSGSTNACYKKNGSPTGVKTIAYKATTTTNVTTTTTTYTGGQQACKNLVDVANDFKSRDANNLVITVGYNLNDTTLCGDNNKSYESHLTNSSTTGSTSNGAWSLSSVTNANGNTLSNCITTVSGTKYLNTSCGQNVTLNYTRTATRNDTAIVQNDTADLPNSSVPNVLAKAAGGNNIDPSYSDHDCSAGSGRAAENADGDYFFCAASGDDMGPIFITALSQVSTGVKLINMPH
jgi:hypothetical protein